MATHMTPYWNNTAFGPMSPYTTMYTNTGMMPFNASMYPVSPIGVYPYMSLSYMYGHIPAFGGDHSMAGVAPLVGNRSETPSFTHAKFSRTRNCAIKGNHSNYYIMRRQPCDDEDEGIQMGRHNLPKRSQECLSHALREDSGSYLGKKHTKRSRGTDLHGEHFYCDMHSVHDQHGKNFSSLNGARDQRAYHAEGSNSEVDYMSSSSDKYDDERHSHNHHNITRYHHERRGNYGSNSSWSRHDEKAKKRVFSDDKGFIKKHGSQFGPRVEPSAGDERKRYKRGEHSRG